MAGGLASAPPNPARLLRLAVLGTMLSAVSLWACSVPVFRYALEHWPPDSYQAIVFHRGPLTAPQQTLATELGRDGLAGRLRANVSVQTVDLAQSTTPEMLELWERAAPATLPWLIVRYPQASRRPDNVVSAPLTAEALQQSLDSPARTELFRRLARGDSAVWVLMEIGNPKRDDETTTLVETRLAYLATVLKLPATDPQDVATGLFSPPEGGLKLAFSLLRVSRSDPAEATFVRMLLGSESDLAGIQEPMLFPVFGRGRALYALAGKGISHETLDEAATFLIGKCSCQVKELNPGVDLLLAADWDKLMKSQSSGDQGLPNLPALAEAAPETVRISGSAEESAVPANPQRLQPRSGSFWFTATLALAGFIAAGLLWLRRK
ncbi:MAG: hypothetical protein HZA92_00595 [Verrucomicrobia bacterium]|nr:hypothetical protein [Verrucomicrobiota bacterium]